MRHVLCLSLLLAGMGASGCSNIPKGVPDLEVGTKERGIASWYGDAFSGQLTANGEAYDMKALTGAHRTLPFGTVVKVTNVQNGRQVRICINDRGPYANGRILDLSHAAAVELELSASGTAPVQIEVVGAPGEMSFGKLLLAPLTWWSSRDTVDLTGAGEDEESGGLHRSEPWISDGARRQPASRRVSLGDLILERRIRREADPRATDPPGDGIPEMEFA